MPISVVTLIKEHGKEEAIRFIDAYLNGFLMMSTTHFEYREVLEKAKHLIEEGKFEELPKVDERLEDLENYDLWN